MRNDNAGIDRPNIVFIFADDWGYGDLGCYGNKVLATPNLDKLAAQGIRFTRFHVTSGVCSPSRTSVITGHFPAMHRVHGHLAGSEINALRNMPDWLNENLEVYLPRMMRNAGYATAHFGKWHLGGGGLPHGNPSAPVPAMYGYDETRVWNGNGPTWKGTRPWPTVRYMDSDTVWVQHSSQLAVDAAIDFAKRHKEAQFFINLWLKDPHTPLWPTDEQRMPYRNFDEPKQTYYSVLTDADRYIGRFLEALRALGLEDNTMVLFSSDNGPEYTSEALGTAGSAGELRGGKRSLYEGGVCVPFIVRWPGVAPVGTVDSESVLSTVDLLPTFCAIVGADLPGSYEPDGEVILDALQGNGHMRSKPLFWEWRFADSEHPTYWPEWAVLSDGWKLLHNTVSGHSELYNLKTDHEERIDLSGSMPDKVDHLKGLWSDWNQDLPE